MKEFIIYFNENELHKNFWQNFLSIQNSPLPAKGKVGTAGGLSSTDGEPGSDGVPKIRQFF